MNDTKKKIRRLFIFLIIISVISSISSIGLLVYENNKYNTYKIAPADLLDYKKVYKNGISYYQGNYKYIVNKKEYIFNYYKLYKDIPERIIQVKYDTTNPSKLYNENYTKYYFIMLFASVSLTILFIVITVSISPSKLNEVITVQVIEFVNCVGGRRIYLNDINIPKDSPDFFTKKYYVFFSDNYDKFKVGNLLKFNKYKYGEALTSEKYRNVSAMTIYNFKDDDFEIVQQV